ncbi:MAG: 2-oxoglutarate dehydrogenase E1 component [Verrucomicrobia bacterium]|nr:2-oxoglutarate dehydrogenase E1 component [Verrucomicrobiota bacterium]MBS0636501.1 2-oxoglutarate dehydrogenase E1 component [Verrucomicrobiota bacterium]
MSIDDINSENLELLEQYSKLFAQNPGTLDASWRDFFEAKSIPPSLKSDDARYRIFGHLNANFYPEGVAKRPKSVALTGDPALEQVYTGSIGYEFYPYCPQEVSDFIISKIEQKPFRFSNDKKQHILHLLNKAESFETFLHTKYVGQKRFSLEGAETLIPMIATLLDKDLTDLIIGMPHRGRLNVLSNILHKSYADIFSEFEDVALDTFETSGDVKYHKGYSSKIGDMRVVLAANPSHLESVDAVVEGIARGLQNPSKVLPLLVHGDAAISGQGVVYETLQMSKLAGYSTGGTIHIVINNHIGFTTLPEDGRSTLYCTDIAKTFGIPVFHVNAEDPESCIFVLELAYEIRQKFGSDVFIDLNCWRKYGHNESDEPAFTQPLIYQNIRKKPSIRAQYHDRLQKEGVEIRLLDEEFKKELSQEHESIKRAAEKVKKDMPSRLVQPRPPEVETAVSEARVHEVIKLLNAVPEGFTLHPRLEQLIKTRKSLETIDWAYAEMLAFGTLLQDKVPIRLAGQDSRRGTFSQRHGMWVDQKTAKRYVPAETIDKDFEIVDSFLSEYAALAFEYGYSLARQNALVLWEAQFGDFANGAQIVIDQYIAPGEQKWNLKSKLTLLLPHGYEGQGPEHSSGRMERFLTLAAEDNMSIAYPSTPAQYFHLLRRQAHLPKPLVVFTPKALLRSTECVSSLSDLTSGKFQEVIDENKPQEKVQRLIFCTGKIYYDLKERAGADTAVIRIEQLYPLNTTALQSIIKRYSNATQFIWAQEEPYNMGARGYIKEPIEQLLPQNKKVEYRGREASASPACGSHLVHEKELQMIRDSLFGESDEKRH